jgi:hypothetical protein
LEKKSCFIFFFSSVEFRNLSPPQTSSMSETEIEWNYDPAKPSLTNIPYHVLETHFLPILPTETIFNLFSTCKLFRRMIQTPTADNNHIWKLDLRFLNDLRLGIPEGWIQGIVYWFDPNQYLCPGCKKRNGDFYWQFRAGFCYDCSFLHTVR